MMTIKFVGDPSVKNNSNFLKFRLILFSTEVSLYIPQVSYRDVIFDMGYHINQALLICKKHDQMIVYIGVELFVLCIHLVRLCRHFALHNYAAREFDHESPQVDQKT